MLKVKSFFGWFNLLNYLSSLEHLNERGQYVKYLVSFTLVDVDKTLDKERHLMQFISQTTAWQI